MTKHYVNIYGKDLKNSQFYNLNPLDRRSTINSTITMKKGKNDFIQVKSNSYLVNVTVAFRLNLMLLHRQ